MENYFNCLPRDLIYTIINYISTKKDLDNFINSNEILIESFSKDDVWKELYYHNYDNEFIDSDVNSWKMYYMKRYSILKTFSVKEDKMIVNDKAIDKLIIKDIYYSYYKSMVIDSRNNLYIKVDYLGYTYIGNLKHQIDKISGTINLYLLTNTGNIFVDCEDDPEDDSSEIIIEKLSPIKLLYNNVNNIIDMSLYMTLFGYITKNKIFITGKSYNYGQNFDINSDNMPEKLTGLNFKQISCSRSHVTVLTEDNEIFIILNMINIKKISCPFNVKKIVTDFNVIFILTYTGEMYEIWLNHKNYIKNSFPLKMEKCELLNIKDIPYTSYFDIRCMIYVTNDNKIIWNYTKYAPYEDKSIDITKKLPFEIDENIIKIVADESRISFIRLE